MTRRAWSGILMVLMLGALALAAVPTASAGAIPDAKKPIKGGTLRIGIANEIATLDPVRQSIGGITTGSDRAFLVYGTLMKLNTKTGAIIPGLAQSITTTDAQTWTLKLRPNVKFSDGTPLDADAVIFNFERFKDPANAFSGAAIVNQIAKMTKIDPQTVEFRLTSPNGSFDIVFTDTVGTMGSPTAIKADPRNWGLKPIGAGPFMVKEWIRDKEISYVRNPTYFDQPRPYLDGVVVRIIPSPQTLAASLKNGEIDAIHVADAVNALPVATADPKNFRGFDSTQVSGGIGVGCNLDRAPCNDVRFREALSLSFDFKSAKQVTLPGVPYPENTLRCMPWGPGSPYCAKDVVVKYNPTKAKKLFDAVKADGISTDITYTWNPPSSAGQINGEWVQQQLAKVGVNVTLRPVTTNEYVSITNTRTFQTAIVFNPPATDMSARFYNDWHSVGGPNGGRDVLNLNNAELDVALEKGRNSIKLEDKIAGFQEAQRIIAKNFLVQWTYPQLLGIVSKRTLQLPSYVNPNAASYRYDEAWFSKQQ